MELRHLRTFVVIAEELHFARAARRLFVDPSAITRTLQALEDELEVSLLVRSRREVKLTAAGRHFAERARRILRDADQAADEARAIANGKRGRLTIALAGYTAISPMPEVIQTLRRDHEEISLGLKYIPSQEQPAALRDGRCDLGLTTMPIRDPDMEIVALLVDRLVLLVADEHPLASRDTVPFTALTNQVHILLAQAEEPALHDAFRNAFTHSQPSSRIIEAPEISTLLALVAANEGISYAPGSMNRLRYQGICTRLLEPSYEVSFFALYPRKTMSPLVQPFLDAFHAVVQE